MKRMSKRFLIVVLVFSILVLVGCKKEAVPPETEKVFSLDKVETTEASASSTATETITYVIYLKVADTPFLMDDLQVVKASDLDEAKENLPLYALKNLLTTTAVRDLVNPIPKETTLIGLDLKDGHAKVNLSQSFVPEKLTKDDAQLAIAAVVNTLTYFPEIDTVEIYVDGTKLNNYFGLDVSKPLSFFDTLYPEK